MQGDATQIHINCKLGQSKKKLTTAALILPQLHLDMFISKAQMKQLVRYNKLIKSEKRLLMFISMEFLGIHVPGYFQQGKSETTQACIP
jgi:hypothetical protein